MTRSNARGDGELEVRFPPGTIRAFKLEPITMVLVHLKEPMHRFVESHD
jgi:hypothetical protein